MTDLIKQFFNESEEPTEYYAIINRYENNEWIDCLDVFEGKDIDRAIDNFAEWASYGPDDVNTCAFCKIADKATFDKLLQIKDSNDQDNPEYHDFLVNFYDNAEVIFSDTGDVCFDIFNEYVQDQLGIDFNALQNTDPDKYDEIYSKFVNLDKQKLIDYNKKYFEKIYKK